MSVYLILSKNNNTHIGVFEMHIDKQLIKASKNGDLEKVKNFLKEGADIHADDDAALMYAKENFQDDVVKLLEECMLQEKRIECLKDLTR